MHSRCFPEDPSEADDIGEQMQVDYPGELHGAALRLDEMLAARAEAALHLDDRPSDIELDSANFQELHHGADANSTG